MRVLLFAVSLLVLCLAGCVKSQDVPDHCFPGDGVINGNLSGDYFVGYAHPQDVEKKKNPTSPTVTMEGGAIITGDNALKPGEATMGGITVYNHSTFVFKKGSINGYIEAYDNSKIIVSGGTNKGVLSLWDNSTATISGGTTEFNVLQERKSTVTVSGGTLNGVNVSQDSTFHMTGGKIEGVFQVSDKAIANIRGGGLPPVSYLFQGTLRVVGKDLVKKLVDPKAEQGNYKKYVLSGKLADGTVIDGAFVNIHNKYPGTLVLVSSDNRAPRP